MPVRTPFGFASTAAEVAAQVDLSGKRAIVTGGAAGIGAETVRVLAACGADVTIADRNLAAASAVAATIRDETGNLLVHVAHLDLADRRSIDRFLSSWWSPLDILVNNARQPAPAELARTDDGWELQFGTNFFGHFELTVGLFDHLVAASQGARVVSVSSSGHLFSPVVFDDINFRFRPYDPVAAFGQSQTATTLLAVAANTEWASAGIVANAVNPGAFADGQNGPLRTAPDRWKTVPQGASTTVLAAVSPLLDGIGGRYFENCNEAPLVRDRAAELHGVAPYALDPDNAERLWAHAFHRL